MQIPLKSFNNIESLVPLEWSEPRDERALFIVSYELQGVPASELPEPVACDLKDVRALFWKGELSYREEVRVTQFWIDKSGRLNVVDPEPTRIVKTPDAMYSVFLTPFTVSKETNKGEIEAEERIEIARSLFGTFQGRNIVFRKLYENTYSFASGDATSWSEPIPVPLSFPSPAITRSGLQPILQAERSRWSLDESERSRVDLSLRWLGQAMFGSGVDAFLKYWFAIETLAMPDDTDIAPLKSLLAKVYGLASPSQANEAFHIGLLCGLRSQIVHKGLLVAIDGHILRYCEYLYHDLLREKLGLPSERRAGYLLSDGSFDYGAYLRSLLRK